MRPKRASAASRSAWARSGSGPPCDATSDSSAATRSMAVSASAFALLCRRNAASASRIAVALAGRSSGACAFARLIAARELLRHGSVVGKRRREHRASHDLHERLALVTRVAGEDLVQRRPDEVRRRSVRRPSGRGPSRGPCREECPRPSPRMHRSFGIAIPQSTR